MKTFKPGDQVEYKPYKIVGKVVGKLRNGNYLVEFIGWGRGHQGNSKDSLLPGAIEKESLGNDYWYCCDCKLKRVSSAVKSIYEIF